MSKRISLGIFLTNWMVGLFLVFLLPTSADATFAVDTKSHLQTSESIFSESFNLPETPSVELDLEGFLSDHRRKGDLVHDSASVYVTPFSEYSTVPFFDIKQTFIHFFHTW